MHTKLRCANRGATRILAYHIQMILDTDCSHFELFHVCGRFFSLILARLFSFNSGYQTYCVTAGTSTPCDHYKNAGPRANCAKRQQLVFRSLS